MPVPAAIALAPAAISLVSNAAQFFGANSQQKKDKEELARLATPFYKVQDEFYGNRNSALESAQSGLTQDSKDYYTDQASRGLGTGISAVLQGGGSPNDIARLLDSYNSGIKSIASEDATRQLDNIRYYHRANTELAGEKIKQWTINEYQPYQNKLKELTQRIAADKQNKFNAIQGAIGSIQAGVTSSQNNGLLKSLFKKGDNKPADQGVTTDNGIEDPFTSFNPNKTATSGDYNWMNTNRAAPTLPTNNPDVATQNNEQPYNDWFNSLTPEQQKILFESGGGM